VLNASKESIIGVLNSVWKRL